MNPISFASRALVSLLVASSILAQEPTRRLEGRVLTAHSEPAVGAMVTAERDGTIVAKTGADALGMFVFGKLPFGELVVRATTPDDVGAGTVDTMTGPGFVTLFLAPARSVRGVVRDKQGQPLADAFVAAVPLGDPSLSAFGAHTSTGADGTFTLPHLPLGPLALRAFHPAHAGAAATLERGDEPVELRMADDEPTAHHFEASGFAAEALAQARLHVVATADQVPIPLPPSLAKPQLEGDNTWTLRGWPTDDSLVATFRVPGMHCEPQQWAVTGARDRTRTFEPSDAVSGPLQGVVKLQDGTLPEAGLRIAVTLGMERHELQTDARGAFATPFPVPHAEDVLVQSLDPRFVVPDDRFYEPVGQRGLRGSHRADRHWLVSMLASSRVHGRVVDAQGIPVAGACVKLMAVATRTMHLFAGGDVLGSDQFAETWTDRQGAYVLTGFSATHNLRLRITHRDGHYEGPVDCDERGDRDCGIVRLGAAATLRGCVRQADGSPATSTWLRVSVWAGDEREYLVAADRAGTFTLRGLPPGACVVWLLSTRKVWRRVDLVEGEVVDVTLP